MTRDEQDTQLVRIARLSMRAARRSVSAYGSVKSRKDFTQPQLISCLVLRAVMRSDYRGVCELLRLSPVLREVLGLEKVPHWTTLQKCMARPQTVAVVEAMIGQILREVGASDVPLDVAVDSTGMQNGQASLHYMTRRWQEQNKKKLAAQSKKKGKGASKTPNDGVVRARKSVKVSVAVVCGLLLPAAVVVDLGSSADMKQMPSLMEQIESNMTPSRLLADGGYDAEWVHEVVREEWGAQSLIPPVPKTADGSIRTYWREQMKELPEEYGRRWHAESFFSGMKRTMLSTLSSRKLQTLLAEAGMKVLAYAIRR